jgi:hypothetical protein
MESLNCEHCCKINFLCGDRLKIWQRNYYEHIIRNEDSYQKIRQYILDNPRNWEQDENNLALRFVLCNGREL